MKPVLAVLLLACGPGAKDPRSLTRAIDRIVQARLDDQKVRPAPPASDAEFLRRACLDLTGRIPSAEDARAFLDSPDLDRRRKLIDRLLSDPRFGTHFATIWANLIVAAGDPVDFFDPAPFTRWMAGELNGGRGWDKIVTSIVSAEGDPAQNPATAFVHANKAQPAALAGATARLFLGLKIQCAECHNDFYSKWTQEDFWGLAAFFGHVDGIQQSDNSVKGIAVAEVQKKQRRSTTYPFVPTTLTGAITIPAAGGNKGAGKVVQARFLDGRSPTLDLSQSPFRPVLAGWLTAPENKSFARSFVNRLWAHLFGSGLYTPVDEWSEKSAAVHAELLDLLAREFVGSGFDVRHLLRSICASEAYGRSGYSILGSPGDAEMFGRMARKVMSPEMFHDSLLQSLGLDSFGAPSSGRGGKPADPRVEFVKFFGAGRDVRENTQSTLGIVHMLRRMNGAAFTGKAPAVDRLVASGAPEEKILEALFLGALSRRPRTEELKAVRDYLSKRRDFGGVLWSLLNTSEFLIYN